MRQTEFIQMVRNELNDYGFKLVIGRGKQINCGSRVSGYFSEVSKEIRVARYSNDFLPTLVHEYSHFQQYAERKFISAGTAVDVLDSWFAGKEYAERELARAFKIVRSCERDAERRSVATIKQYNLPVNLDLYIRRANCYIYAHYIMHRYRKFWAFKRDPFRSHTVLAMMPNSFRAQSHQTLPPDIDSALESLI